MDDQQGLFDARPYEVLPPVTPTGAPMSADRRRTRRQLEGLSRGRHPLEPVAGRALKLHPEGARWDDRNAPGRRCGDCWHRVPGRYQKCGYGAPQRITHSAASDVRTWWPACTDHSYSDPDADPPYEGGWYDDPEDDADDRLDDEDDDGPHGPDSAEPWPDDVFLPPRRRVETVTPAGGVL